MPFSPKRCDFTRKEGFYSLNIIFRDFLLTEYHFPEFCINWISFPGIFYSNARFEKCARLHQTRVLGDRAIFFKFLVDGGFQGGYGMKFGKKKFFSSEVRFFKSWALSGIFYSTATVYVVHFLSPGHFPGFSTPQEFLCSTFSKSWAFSGIFYSSRIFM